MIDNFKGKYFFLSNFYNIAVVYDGIQYMNNEAAFQAQKMVNWEDRKDFSELKPGVAKRKGRHVELRDDWEEIKVSLMLEICWTKFISHPELSKKLIETYPHELVEGNDWGDRYWGVCDNEGKNVLGEILMYIRNHIILQDMDLKTLQQMRPITLEQIIEDRIERRN